MNEEKVAAHPVHRGCWAPELKGKTAIITGAGRLRSIGRAIAHELARQGVNIVLTGTGRSPDDFPSEEKQVGWRDVQSVASEVEALGSKAAAHVSDVSNPTAIRNLLIATIERFGAIDILVNNAGAARGADRTSVVDLAREDWARVFQVNVEGTFLMSQSVARLMIERGCGGSIINISSIAARLALPNTAAYCASKAAINALSRTMAMELAKDGIRVNAILPGIIETSRMDGMGRGQEWKAFVTRVTPLGIAGTGAEVAQLCTYLCSDMGAWMTGQDIAIDGGASWH